MNILNKIKELSEANFKEVQNLRRSLHKNPELSFFEKKTQKFICDFLKKESIPFFKSKVGYGVVGLIEGKFPEKYCIGLRADMDALPIQETNNVKYKSIINGVMHACGHDVHMSCLMGAAKILKSFKTSFHGTVKLIFQPAEEMIPGGAKQMIDEGVLEDPNVNIMLAQHVSPEIKSGAVGMKEDMFMASTDEIYINIIGQGGHAALPSKNINPILIASKVILTLNEFFLSQKEENVFSIGYIEAKGSTNIIPDQVELKGTFRAMDEDFRRKSHSSIKNIIEEISSGFGASFKLNIKQGYPYLQNNIELTNKIFNYSKQYLGNENVFKIEKRMTGEDFAYFSLARPSCFYRLGVGGEDVKNLHTSVFDIDEDSLKIGVGLLVWNTLSILENI
tara:strand:+ start:565 stop:1740 length:1176 start_codon:yes stop_codon:yes gene_type:complete